MNAWGTRQQGRPLREVFALLSTEESLGQKHSSVPAACLYPHPVTMGAPRGWFEGTMSSNGLEQAKR